ncbi:MAG TPA: amidohydrolase family protein [Noviherbaspirillum sp.]
MIVDTHAHIFSATGPFAPGARYWPDYEASVEQWLALWPAAGVTHGVLVQPSFLGTDNSQLLAALQARPALLRGVVVVDPSVTRGELQQWHELGVRGVRLNLLGVADLSVFGGPDWKSVFGTMAELGWHLEVQCEGERFAALLSVLHDLPRSLALVIDHFGLPDPATSEACTGVTAILRAARTRPVHIKLSAPYRLRGADPQKYAALYLAELGEERLLWGSDWPWTNHEHGRVYADCLRALHGWLGQKKDEETILEATPKRLYGFGVC